MQQWFQNNNKKNFEKAEYTELSIKKKKTFMNRFNLLERYEILNIKLSEFGKYRAKAS